LEFAQSRCENDGVGGCADIFFYWCDDDSVFNLVGKIMWKKLVNVG
jgi:hypothetical protein